MNADRRHVGQVCIALINECLEIGEMSETTHTAVGDAIKHLTKAEYWQLENQKRHEGKNPATDKQLAICRVALPALELASKAFTAGNYPRVVAKLTIAVNTDGTKTRKSS